MVIDLVDRKTKCQALWLVVVVLFLAGCGDRCKIGGGTQPVEKAYELVETVPSSAQVVAFAEQFEVLLDKKAWALEVFPVVAPGPGKLHWWQQAGAKLDGPSAAFWADEQWVIVAAVDKDRDVDLSAWPVHGTRRYDEDGNGWIESDTDGHWTRWMSTDGRRIAVGWSFGSDFEPLGDRIWHLDGDHWKGETRHSEARHLAEFAKGEVAYGAVDVAALVSRLEGEGRAKLLRDQLATQIGTVHWWIGVQPDEDGYHVDLFTPARLEDVMVLGDLGQARGDLPHLGGLARPGVPAILRLSMDPENLLDLFLSTLHPDERRQFDDTVDRLRDDLQIDLRRDVVDNVSGQVAVVVFSLEDLFFELRGMERVAATFRLETTRDAVVIPFDDREAILRVLDAVTQMSRGSLRRQAMEHTIQYAWFDDGALSWALILGEEQMVLVDSIIAFDHVRSWERSPRPLEGILARRDVDSVLSSRRGLGGYLDLATVRSIARESGDEGLTSWLRPVDAVRIETDANDRPDHTRLHIWLSRQGREDIHGSP